MRKKVVNGLFYCIVFVMAFMLMEGCTIENNNSPTVDKNQIQTVKSNNSISNDEGKDSSLDQSIVERVEVSRLKNGQLREVIEDKEETLENGVYGCISKSEGNYYILINGVDYGYSNISYRIKDRVLFIKYNTQCENGLRVKELFLIKANNAETFDKVELVNNGNKETFHMLFQ